MSSELGGPAGDPLFSCDTNMPSTLVGKRLFKVNAQIHFDHGEISVLDGTGHPIQVLSLALRDKYRLYQPKLLMAIDPNVQPWVQNTL